MIIKSADQQRAFVVGRQAGVRSTAELVDQLTEQLHEARRELQEARAEYQSRIANAKAHFSSEAEAMRKELEATIASLHDLRSSMLDAWTRRESDRLQ
jgi:F0F1-type ATP synthase membrane subunit b/b'